jgi:hypothetical protein
MFISMPASPASARWMNRPTLNSSESPGRIGNSRPHSTNTIATLTQNIAGPNRSSSHSGSIQSRPSSSGAVSRASITG